MKIGESLLINGSGLQAVIGSIRRHNWQTSEGQANDFIDNRFFKELDDSGFIKPLSGR